MQSPKEKQGEITKPSLAINAKKYRKTIEWKKTRDLFKKIIDTKGTFHVSSIQFSVSVVFNSLWPHRCLATLSITNTYSNSCPSSWWCHPIISSSVVCFSSCLQTFPASGSFPMSQFFMSDGQSIGVSISASVFPTNIQDWCTPGLTDFISFQSKEHSRVFSSTTIWKHQFFSTQLYGPTLTSISDYRKNNSFD